jgi:hypothetical protein
MGDMKNVYKILSVNLKERDHSEDPGVKGRIIFEWNLGKWGVRCGLDSSGSGQGPAAHCCEHGNEPSSFIKGGEFLD